MPHHHVRQWTENLMDVTKSVRVDPDHVNAIGCGAAGDVYRCLYEWQEEGQVFGIKVVVKVFQGGPQEHKRVEERVMREIAAWRHLEHPNVSRFLGIAYLLPNRPPGLVSLYLRQNDLLEFVGQDFSKKVQKAREIACGLQYLHTMGVVHGDVKVANVLLSDDGVAQLNDFGISQIIGVRGFTTKILHNIRHNAPEIMPIKEEDDENVRPTKESDIFSLGILLLQVFHGRDTELQKGMPYNHVRFRNGAGRELRLLRLIHAGERPIRERYRPMPDHYWAIISQCWNGKPEMRPTIDQVNLLLQS